MHDSRTASSQRIFNWKFVVLSSLFFIVVTLVFIFTFSMQRINHHKAEQATAASVFTSQLMTIAVDTREQNLDGVVSAFMGTLTGVKIFSCVQLTIDSMNRSYGWPYQSCQDSASRDASRFEITSRRMERPDAEVSISAILDDDAPIEKFATEAKHIAVSALVMGLIALFAVNFAFNRAIRRPLRNLLEELREVLAGPGDVSKLEKNSNISDFTRSYDALLERARELKRKEAFWRAVTESSFDCIVSEDGTGHIIDFNAAGEKTFGYRREDVIGKRVSDLLFPDHSRKVLKREWASYLATDKSRIVGKTLEVEALTKDGSPLSVELSIATISLEGEKYFTTYIKDVTELRQTLNARKENEAMLTQSAEMAHLGYAIWDDTLDKDISVSEELARIHGMTREQYQETIVSMETYLELVVPEDREKYTAYEDHFDPDSSIKIASIEYCIRRPDGELRYLYQRSQYLPVTSGKPTQSIIVIQDVTDQKQVELVLQQSQQALEESEAILAQSATMANLGHCIWDNAEKSYLIVSDRWAAIHGYSKHVFMTNFSHHDSYIKLIHPEDRKRHDLWYENKNTMEIEYRIIRKDGEIRHVIERHKSLIHESGKVNRTLLTILDITDRVERENDLDEARKAAENASIAKSSFLAVMSHEIRTPLNAVLGAFGLIESANLDPKAEKFLNVGKKGAESLLLIVNDILDFSKIEAGKLQLEPALFNVQQSIDDVLQVLEPRALEKQISLNGSVGLDIPEFLIGDASRIRQVLLNLCSNAVRFTTEGGVKIILTTNRQSEDVAHIRFQVEDTGIGVPLENQKHLFEEFWGTNATTRGNIGGTGLGLPISAQLVEMMGGRIGFQSEPDQGSMFWFELPLKTADQDTIKVEKDRSENLRQTRAYTDLPVLQGRVLLAEDNPANQLIGQTVLERMGLKVGVAANGHEVIESLRSMPYDLVLMDINMPEMNGIEATAAIRKLPGSLARIPIIAMTALAMPGDREEILSKGMDGYVSKPINREELYQSISRLLNSHDLPTATPHSEDFAETTGAEVPIMDTEVFDNLVDDVGAELLPTIIETYLAELSDHMKAITTGARREDCELVATGAHPMKSSSAYFGALALSALGSQLEQAAREQDLEAINLDIVTLPDLCQQTRSALIKISSGISGESTSDSDIVR